MSLISIHQAKEQGILPSCLHEATISRWILHGVKDPSGVLIRLKAVRLGARWFVTPEDVQEFITASTSPQEENSNAPTPRRRPRTSTSYKHKKTPAVSN